MKKVRVINHKNNNNLDLLATLIHELKTPITSIKEAIALISDLNQRNLNPKSNYILSIAQDEVNRLAKMIDNFLKFASIESGKIHLQTEPTNIHELMSHVVESQSLMIQKKRMLVKKNYMSKPVSVLVDYDRIFEAISNLIDNALKYTPENGKIIISTEFLKPKSAIMRKRNLNPTNNYLLITISDTGPGIAQKNLERIFKKFERIKTSNKTRGIGLGLTITKNIIELHNGKIWATSEKNKGAVFHIALPLKA